MEEKKEDGAERTAGTAGAISGGIGTGILVASLIPVPVVDVLVGAVVGAVPEERAGPPLAPILGRQNVARDRSKRRLQCQSASRDSRRSGAWRDARRCREETQTPRSPGVLPRSTT
jgi:hypothetical protein